MSRVQMGGLYWYTWYWFRFMVVPKFDKGYWLRHCQYQGHLLFAYNLAFHIQCEQHCQMIRSDLAHGWRFTEPTVKSQLAINY